MDVIDQINHSLDNVTGVPIPSGGSLQDVQGMGNGYRESANFAIQATRDAANIAGIDLPYVLFGWAFIQSGYREVIELPDSTTLSVKFGLLQNLTDTAANYDKVQLIYTNGGNTDTITIQSKASSAYPTLLANMASDVFTITKLRQSISPQTETSQFATSLKIVNRSIFGKREENDLNIDSYKRPDQFQSGIIDINITASLDKESAFVGAIIPVAGLSVTNSFSVSRIRKFNRNVLMK